MFHICLFKAGYIITIYIYNYIMLVLPLKSLLSTLKCGPIGTTPHWDLACGNLTVAFAGFSDDWVNKHTTSYQNHIINRAWFHS